MTVLTRRSFNSLAAATLASSLTRSLWAREASLQSGGRYFYFALLADTHIIDNFYVKGSENGVEDNESILVTTPRLTAARDLINSLNPAIEQVFVLGDYFHNYPSTDYDFYFKNTTRLDNAKAITDGFHMPVHIGFGNHDYDVRHVSREMSHQTPPAKTPTTALNQNAERHPCCRISQVSRGGVRPLPAPTPAKIRPLIRPRSSAGTQRATYWLAEGYITASPAPRANRMHTRSATA